MEQSELGFERVTLTAGLHVCKQQISSAVSVSAHVVFQGDYET